MTIQEIYEDYGQLHIDCELNDEGGSFDGCTCAVRKMVEDVVRQVMLDIDSQFLDKSHMIVSGLDGDKFQIKKIDWDSIRKSVLQSV